jgi:hypothetical protein
MMVFGPNLLPCIAFSFSLCGLFGGTSAAAADWPSIAMPPNVSAFAVGEELTANGIPMRVQGFVSKDMSVPQLAEWFRHSMGRPLVEDKLGNKLILGRAEGGYYLSVQLEPAGLQGRGGSKGLLTVSDIAAMNQNRERESVATQDWLRRWPSGTQIFSRMTSQDRGKASLHVGLRNGHSESLNRDALVDVMKQDGFLLEREVSAIGNTADQLPAHLRGGKTLFFKGEGKEGMATIGHDNQGRTAIVLNTLTAIETYPK